MAGLLFAINAAKAASVTLLTKAAVTETNTAYAQGGIACVWSTGDSFQAHVEDTLRAGAGLCRREAVETIVHGGPRAIDELVRLGARFSRANDADGADYDLGREGGHSQRRILHARDLTGGEIMRALIEAASALPNLQILENQLAVDLLIGPAGAGNGGVARCLGAYVLDRADLSVRPHTARVTLLATGGAGRLYQNTTNPAVACGDGVAMAYRAGAAVANLEFIQFHPTALHHPADSFLLSEALRGEGARLRLPDGTPFMERYHQQAELAPRDIVARAIYAEMARHGLDCVYLDITHREADFVQRRFPYIVERCRAVGIDPTREPIPVAPAAHYLCGGVVTDLSGSTSIPGLYAAGEVAMTGLHGANRLASNSLLEAAVMALRAYDAAREEAFAVQVKAAGVALPALDSTPDADVEEVPRLMWEGAGIVRSNEGLERASQRLSLLRERHRPFDKGPLTPDEVEGENLLTVAELVVRSAISRKESRGAHYNVDCPSRSDSSWQRDTLLVRPAS